ncbi:MAG TPA: hypothetical protein VGD69_31425 [Herpetosiphonaceae bacterium]
MNNSQQSGVLDHPGARPQPSNTGGRPVGVALVAIMFLFYAVVVGFNAFIAFQALGMAGLSAAARGDARLDLILSLVQLPFYVVTAFGLWRLRQWGHYLALVFLALNIVRFVVEAFSFPTLTYGLLAALSRSVIPFTIMLYLLHPMIRSVFRGRDR